MQTLQRGVHRARLAASDDDRAAALALRSVCFRDGTACDLDAFDSVCQHLLVEEIYTGRLVCTFRLLPLRRGNEIGRSYAAQHYGLSALHAFAGPMVEIGRFCILPALRDPDVLRVAWAAMTRFVDEAGAEFLFGCASFQGIDAEAHHDAFTLLAARHLAPNRWLPAVKAPDICRFAEWPGHAPDAKRALKAMPPLLRTYLAMGGWVSDHAVVDRDLGTLHVFTGVEIGAIPATRKRLLRAVAGQAPSRRLQHRA